MNTHSTCIFLARQALFIRLGDGNKRPWLNEHVLSAQDNELRSKSVPTALKRLLGIFRCSA